MKDLLIGHVPILASLPPAELDRLAPSLSKRTFPANTVIFKEGERGDVFYIILSGQAQVIKALGTADERVLAVSGAGEFVGEMSLLNANGLRTADVRALTAVEALEVPCDEFDALLKRYPSVGYELVHVLSQRLDATNTATIRDLHEKNRELTASHQQLSVEHRRVKSARRLITVLLGGLLLLATGVALSLGYFLLSARTALDAPSDIVLLMAEFGRAFVIPGDVASSKNPQPATPDTIAAGRRTFIARCLICHGTDGKGQTAIGTHTYPRASDLTATRTQSRTDGALFWIVENGSPHTGMPGWKGTLSNDDIWRVVNYVRLLPQGTDAIAKLLPTPTATPTLPPTPTLAPQATAVPTAIRPSATLTVTIDNYQYLPPTLTVSIGTRVVWANQDDDVHNVVSEDNSKLLNAPLFVQGESFSFVFTQAGAYRYFCEPHDFMHGVVVVR
ncbi:MAG: cyclic nucleotide-binding domain-containing protein [Chloroflexota bacterium]